MPNGELLKGLESDLRIVSNQVANMRQELSEAALVWRPEPKAWSIAEVLGHLHTTNALYLPKLDEAMERASRRPSAARQPFRPRTLAGWFVKVAGPQSEKRLKAPGRFKPTEGDASPGMVDRFLDQQIALTGRVQAAKDCDLNKPRFGSPITPLIRLSVGECLLLLVRHEQRHIQQAKRVREAEGFPG
jgi:hypothetical protein